jgi:DNA-binding NarL/FixJ family response regulator
VNVLLVVSDLFFREKVVAAARELGVPLTVARSEGKVVEALASSQFQVALIDLHLKEDGATSIGALLKERSPATKLVGFFSHVDEAAATSALAAGFDEVMPRSRFFARLPDMLSEVNRS